MKDWKQTLIQQDSPIIDAINIIDQSALQIALVIDHSQRLLGTVTDGDVRSAILRGISLSSPVSKIMCASPTVASKGTPNEDLLAIMRSADVLQIPVVDRHGCVTGLEVLKNLVNPSHMDHWVVLMAGGFGKRLRPLTDDCPKPLLKINKKPILETILENFIQQGFYRFFLSVNYKASMIKDYFGDGGRWGIRIEYLNEKEPMGTAGSLSLLPEPPTKPVFVMNGDLLTKVNFKQLHAFHAEHDAMATMCVREYDFEVPFGVVRSEEHVFLGIDEKPVQKLFVNAGIYVLVPEIITNLPANTYIDMTTVFQETVKNGQKAVVFPIREYWMDIGRKTDFIRADGDYDDHFETEAGN